MGKKKAFIDKKSAVTYNLIYRSTEDADAAPERLLVEADKGVGLGRPDVEAAAEQFAALAAAGRRYPPGHPLAWVEEGEGGGELSEERRHELLQLGFPDDGYDYLRHLRTLGQGAASLEGGDNGAAAPTAQPGGGNAGPSVFVPAAEVAAPEEDVRLYDASALTLLQRAEHEEAAAGLMGGVTTFSRERRAARGAVERELAEVEELMRRLEEEDEDGEECEEGGVGDLLDDFVLTATEMDAACVRPEGGALPQDAEGQEGRELYSSSEEEEGEGEEYGEEGLDDRAWSSGSSSGGEERDACGGARGSSSQSRGRAGSIASTYWREERRDRKELLAVIDERFEALAVEYDEDELGEMEEQEAEIQGRASLADFSAVLDDFHATHSQSARAYENNVPYYAPGYRSAISAELERHGLSDDDGEVAIAKAHEALRRAEQDDERGDRGEEREVVWMEGSGGGTAARERWDCESVLSLRSNLDNHPGSIREPVVGQGMIKLGRYGIPMGVLPGRPTAAALRQLHNTGSGSSGAAAAGHKGLGGADAGGARVQAAEVLQRDRGESAEEKRARKAAVKEAKREARAAKKAVKGMFKEEEAKAQHRAACAQVPAAIRLA